MPVSIPVEYSKDDPSLALRQACAMNDIPNIRCFLKNGAEINSQGAKSGRTALHVAADKGCLEAVALLLNYNANFLIKDVEGKTSQELAILAKNEEVQHLIENFIIAKMVNDKTKSLLKMKRYRGKEHDEREMKQVEDLRDTAFRSVPFLPYDDEETQKMVGLFRTQCSKTMNMTVSILGYFAKNGLPTIPVSCGEVVSVALGYLLNNSKTKNKNIFALELSDKNGLNHTFAGISNSSSVGVELKEKEYHRTTVFCDPFATKETEQVVCAIFPQENSQWWLVHKNILKIIGIVPYGELPTMARTCGDQKPFESTSFEAFKTLCRTNILMSIEALNKRLQERDTDEGSVCRTQTLDYSSAAGTGVSAHDAADSKAAPPARV